MERFSYKVGVVHMGVHISRHLKDEMALAADKQLRVISNRLIFETVIPLGH